MSALPPKADIALRRATKQSVTPIGHPALRAGGGAVYINIAIVAQGQGLMISDDW